jgi:hypothetical protein
MKKFPTYEEWRDLVKEAIDLHDNDMFLMYIELMMDNAVKMRDYLPMDYVLKLIPEQDYE